MSRCMPLVGLPARHFALVDDMCDAYVFIYFSTRMLYLSEGEPNTISDLYGCHADLLTKSMMPYSLISGKITGVSVVVMS